METTNLETRMNDDIFEQILPTYGNRRINQPVWNEAQRMFICDEYESASGHRYYKGVRFCENIVIVEKAGLYHNWTYLDGLEVYGFNGEKLNLLQKKEYQNQFRDDDFVREESVRLVFKYLKGALMMQPDASLSDPAIEAKAQKVVEACYKSLLDSDFTRLKLTKIIPQLK